ncbi:MAG: matrixin family metalloprotease [Acidobacteriota bacterium]
MRTTNRRLLGTLTVVALVLATAQTTRSFSTLGSTWADGIITMEMQLAGGANLADGSTNFNAAATSTLTIWNESLTRVRFASVNSTAGHGDGDQINQVFFDSNYYGISFDRDLLAITTRWTLGRERVEADVVFNNAYQWDSYRGNVRASGVWDLRRVALHEFGHVLGLDHPDEHGQNVNALMNSTLGNLDALTADDIAGVKSLYGARTGAPGNVTFPPRNEPNDFYNQLLAVYAGELRAAPSATYVDPEGAVIWLTEYARQRVGQCGHGTATVNTLNQVTSNGSTLVCANTPVGPIPFPPRNEGLLFMNLLDGTYRDSLHRSLGSSVVNNEGAVVWVLEYLRYRLNNCNHTDATNKVLQQIRGLGIQPICTE